MGIMALTIGLIICFIYFWLIDSLNELEEHQLFIIWILKMNEYLKPFKTIVNYNDKFWNKELIKDLKELDRITERFEQNNLTK